MSRSLMATGGQVERQLAPGLSKPPVGEQMPDPDGKVYLRKQRTNRGVAGYKVGKDDPARYVVIDPETGKPDKSTPITSSRTPRK